MEGNKSSISKSLHSLKSSLTIVYGYLQLIEKEISNNSEDKNKLLELVEKAKDASTSLEKRISEIEDQASSV